MKKYQKSKIFDDDDIKRSEKFSPLSEEKAIGNRRRAYPIDSVKYFSNEDFEFVRIFNGQTFLTRVEFFKNKPLKSERRKWDALFEITKKFPDIFLMKNMSAKIVRTKNILVIDYDIDYVYSVSIIIRKIKLFLFKFFSLVNELYDKGLLLQRAPLRMFALSNKNLCIR